MAKVNVSIQAVTILLNLATAELKKLATDLPAPVNAMPRLLTSRETENIIGCSYATLHRSVKQGKLRAIKIGRSLRFHLDDIKAFVDASRTEGGE